MVMRRRSPYWLRQYHSRAIHRLAFKLQRDGLTRGLSEQQEWLFQACVSELEYRRRHADRPAWACACQLCIPPFPD
jgi:hypothetical protein